MTVQMSVHRHEFSFPAKEEPGWAPKVDRWYQLDAFSYGLCQAWWVLRDEVGAAPAFLFLASPQASNETDWGFTSAGAASPSKFVHTLPNVRASAFCQVMEWNGPMLCVQKDPETIASAVSEAARLIGPQWPAIWVVSVVPQCNEARYLAQLLVLGEGLKTFQFEVSSAVAQSAPDMYFMRWLHEPGGKAFGLPGGLVVKHNRDFS